LIDIPNCITADAGGARNRPDQCRGCCKRRLRQSRGIAADFLRESARDGLRSGDGLELRNAGAVKTAAETEASFEIAFESAAIDQRGGRQRAAYDGVAQIVERTLDPFTEARRRYAPRHSDDGRQRRSMLAASALMTCSLPDQR